MLEGRQPVIHLMAEQLVYVGHVYSTIVYILVSYGLDVFTKGDSHTCRMSRLMEVFEEPFSFKMCSFFDGRKIAGMWFLLVLSLWSDLVTMPVTLYLWIWFIANRGAPSQCGALGTSPFEDCRTSPILGILRSAHAVFPVTGSCIWPAVDAGLDFVTGTTSLYRDQTPREIGSPILRFYSDPTLSIYIDLYFPGRFLMHRRLRKLKRNPLD